MTNEKPKMLSIEDFHAMRPGTMIYEAFYFDGLEDFDPLCFAMWVFIGIHKDDKKPVIAETTSGFDGYITSLEEGFDRVFFLEPSHAIDHQLARVKEKAAGLNAWAAELEKNREKHTKLIRQLLKDGKIKENPPKPA